MKSYRQIVNEDLRKWLVKEETKKSYSCNSNGDDDESDDESSSKSDGRKESKSKGSKKKRDIESSTEHGESSIKEDYTRLNQYGSTYSVTFIFRGMSKTIQMFFPQTGRPLKRDVQYELEKIYPTGKVIYFAPSFKDPTKPLIVIEN
jgi:hypothetical protein